MCSLPGLPKKSKCQLIKTNLFKDFLFEDLRKSVPRLPVFSKRLQVGFWMFISDTSDVQILEILFLGEGRVSALCRRVKRVSANLRINYPPASEASKGVYSNQAQKISPARILSTLGCL